jgi:hypothetical protein
MRTNRCCSRCGSPSLDDLAVIEVKTADLMLEQGKMVNLCSDCWDRLGEWLLSPRQTAAFALRGAMACSPG